MRGRGKLWLLLIVLAAILCMVDAKPVNAEKRPTYKVTKVAGKYKTSFRKNGRVFYSVKTKKKPVVKFISTRKLTLKMIESRKGKGIIYVEIDNGIVLNHKKDGIDELGYYVCYKRVKKARKGSKIRSYFVYDPNNNYCDGIEGRCDYIIRR